MGALGVNIEKLSVIKLSLVCGKIWPKSVGGVIFGLPIVKGMKIVLTKNRV